MTAVSAQLALALEVRRARGRADFIVAPCNAAAVAWIDRWPDWPAHALALYGPAGAGKSHLAQVYSEKSGAEWVPAAALGGLGPARLRSAARAAVIDPLEADDGWDEQALLHLLNLAREIRGSVLLVGRSAPGRLARMPDLSSRLSALPAARLGEADDALLAALLAKHFAERQLRVAEDVVRFLLARMERSFGSALELVERLDRLALAEQRAVTVPLARRALAQLEASDRARY
ncbi:MAG TPA: DNA replication protein [Alphaproteobacteria bacterium]|nr:DNA replication protein [Alphaproteobacteria bacterium]